MKINSLDLTNYRNYNHFHIEFSDEINILIGNNGEGKTNLIEAIYLLSLARSFRTRINKQMITFNQDFTKVEGNIISLNRKHKLSIIIGEDFKRAKVDNKDIHKISEYVGYLNTVIFTPDDLSIIKDSPSKRRKFINLELSKINPLYLYNLSNYHKLLKERNKYLKLLNNKHKKADDYLEVLDEQMASLQINIINSRKEFINSLNNYVKRIYKSFSNDSKEIRIDYDCFTNEVNENKILEIYKKNYNRDIKYCKTTKGIHNDDLKIYIDDKLASDFASQGQQRSIVLSLKIGLINLIKEKVGEYPILLLDDVLSELDDERKSKLLDLLSKNIQTFITTTSIDGINHETVVKANKIYIGKENM
ncbi:MAG: DNA replication/repair protein RecF [Thomasclavelia sp.]|nr:DNA replication/repair protein RecF [Thomasclavelia sp.]